LSVTHSSLTCNYCWHAVPLIGGRQTVPAGVRRIGAVNTTTAAPAADVSVAVLDTGVDLTHPDLNVVPGVNCIAPGTPPNDVDSHGTHCAGSVAAKNDAGGVIGVAPGTKIVAVKVSHA
jgi:subtilisin